MKPKIRADSHQGHGPRADQTGQIHISDFRFLRTISLAKRSRSIHLGQREKNSVRANVFCFASEPGHRKTRSALPKSARFGHQHNAHLINSKTAAAGRDDRDSSRGLLWSVTPPNNGRPRGVSRLALCRLRRGGNCGSLGDQCASVVNQALQPVGCNGQCGIIHRAVVSSSGFGALRL